MGSRSALSPSTVMQPERLSTRHTTDAFFIEDIRITFLMHMWGSSAILMCTQHEAEHDQGLLQSKLGSCHLLAGYQLSSGQ